MIQHLLRRACISVLCLIAILIVVPSVSAATGDTEGASQALIEACNNLETTVDLTQYQITKDQLSEIFDDSLDWGEYPWYVRWYSYTHYPETGLVAKVTFQYLDPEIYDYALYEQRVAEILAETVHEGMSQWQIALSIHDYLAANIAYDETLTYRRGYDGIVNGLVVCSGYAEAYMDLLQRAGIPCCKISSEGMNHAWNQVQINGEWYHVDVTWDDPVSDTEGRVMHKYFLLSDEAISDEEHEHYGWEGDIQCTDTSMDTDCFWHGIESQICYTGDDLCYFREKTDKTVYTIYSRTGDGDEKKLTSCDAGYIKITGSHENGTHYSNFGLSIYDGKLYFSDMTKVYRVDKNGKNKKTIYSHDYKSLNTFIAGSHVADGILYLTIATSDRELTTLQMDLGLSSHSHNYSSQLVAPGCLSKGYTHYSCECGIEYTAGHTAATGHSLNEGIVITEATTLSTGLLRRTCTVCSETCDEIIPILTDTETVPIGSSGTNDSDDFEVPSDLWIVAGIAAVLMLFRKKKK